MPTYCTGKEVQYLDRETGELITSTTEKTYSYKLKDNDEFAMTYYKFILKVMSNIKSEKTFVLFFHIMNLANYNTGEVVISSPIRKKICKEMDIKNSNFTKYINELKQHKVIVGSRGLYLINPEIFWKGDRNIRNQAVKNKLFYVKFGFCDNPNGESEDASFSQNTL